MCLKCNPMRKFMETTRKHQQLIMNYFKAKKVYSSSVADGLNRKVDSLPENPTGFESMKSPESLCCSI